MPLVSVVTKNPIIGIGAGLFAGGMTFFKKSSDLECQKMQRDQLKDRFFDALVSSQQASFKKYNMRHLSDLLKLKDPSIIMMPGIGSG